MKKHILIVGPSRSGKSTLARRISKELGYNHIQLDDLVSGFQYAFPELGIIHDSKKEKEIAKKFTKFLTGVLWECQEGINVHNNNFYIFEGVFIDFDVLFENFKKEDFYIIGLHYNKDEKTLFEEIRKYDTPDEWTYKNSDDELKNNIEAFLDTNKYLKGVYQKYNILSYDTTNDRADVIEKILMDLKTQNEK